MRDPALEKRVLGDRLPGSSSPARGVSARRPAPPPPPSPRPRPACVSSSPRPTPRTPWAMPWASRSVPSRPRSPARRGRLLAAEIDAPRALARWRRRPPRRARAAGARRHLPRRGRRRPAARPGAARRRRAGRAPRALPVWPRATGCERVVVDTAPTAHTLRLLQGPAAVGRAAARPGRPERASTALHRRALGGGYRPGPGRRARRRARGGRPGARGAAARSERARSSGSCCPRRSL